MYGVFYVNSWCVCKNGDPQVLDKLLEKKLLPGVKNSVEFEYQHYIL